MHSAFSITQLFRNLQRLITNESADPADPHFVATHKSAPPHFYLQGGGIENAFRANK